MGERLASRLRWFALVVGVALGARSASAEEAATAPTKQTEDPYPEDFRKRVNAAVFTIRYAARTKPTPGTEQRSS